jgi:DnaK suppressor protein
LLAEIVAEDAAAEGNAVPVTLDQEAVGRISRIDAMQVQAMALATQARRRGRKVALEGALRRLASDDFGWCTACGEEIAPARVMNDPVVTLCVGCAATR